MITSSTIPSSPSVTKSVVRRIIDYDIILYTKLYTFNIIREDNLAPSIQCNGSVWMCILRNHMMFHWHGGMMRWRIIGRWRKIHKSRWRWPCWVFACRIHLFFCSFFLPQRRNQQDKRRLCLRTKEGLSVRPLDTLSFLYDHILVLCNSSSNDEESLSYLCCGHICK